MSHASSACKHNKEELSLYGAGLCGGHLYCSPRHSLLLHCLLDVLLPSGRRQLSLARLSSQCMPAQSTWPVMSECMMTRSAFGKGTIHMHIAERCSRACLCCYLQRLVALYALLAFLHAVNRCVLLLQANSFGFCYSTCSPSPTSPFLVSTPSCCCNLVCPAVSPHKTLFSWNATAAYL